MLRQWFWGRGKRTHYNRKALSPHSPVPSSKQGAGGYMYVNASVLCLSDVAGVAALAGVAGVVGLRGTAGVIALLLLRI